MERSRSCRWMMRRARRATCSSSRWRRSHDGDLLMSRATDRPGHSQAGAIERDFVAAWWLLAEAGGAELHDEPGLRWFASCLDDPHLNAVIETGLDEADADRRAEGLVTELRRRRVSFLW